jgi:hypothetical protein
MVPLFAADVVMSDLTAVNGFPLPGGERAKPRAPDADSCSAP